MKIFTSSSFFIITTLILFFTSAYGSDVYIKVDENDFGQGVLRQRNFECLVITPAHVVENSYKIDLTTADKSKHSAELLEIFPGDVGVLRITDDPSPCRHTSWQDKTNLDVLLDMEKRGELRTMLADGSLRVTPVDIVSYDKYKNINIRPQNASDTIVKGDSGSLLYISGQFSGMLLSVKNGVGNVIRQDALANTLALFFNDSSPMSKKLVSSQPKAKESTVSTQKQKNGNEQEFSGTIAQSAVTEHRLKLEENSPVRLHFNPTGDQGKFSVEILDSARRIVYQNSRKSYSGRDTFDIPFTPPKTDVYSLQILGTAGESKYAGVIVPIAFDSQLRNSANVLQFGENPAEGIIVTGAIAEYRVKLEENSPVRFTLPSTGDNAKISFQILDSSKKTVYRDQKKQYSLSENINIPFTPPRNDIYTLHLIGVDGEGKYAIKVVPIALNSQLRNQSNILLIGGNTASGVIAQGAVAEYQFDLEAHTPVKLSFLATGDLGKFTVEIFDSNNRAIYNDPYKLYSGAERFSIPFTVLKSDTYHIHIKGVEGESKYAFNIKHKADNSSE